jgi:hypothetical protein
MARHAAATAVRGAIVPETNQRIRFGDTMAEQGAQREVQIAGERFRLRAHDVESAMLTVAPEPITSHFVVVGSQRYPPKQVIGAVTGLDRADFTTHQARRILMRLGFAAGRRSGTARTDGEVRGRSNRSTRPTADDASSLADRLRPLAGSWVAIRDGDVLHSADTAQHLVSWLSTHGQRADTMYRVPDSELAGTGLAPL